MKEDVFSFESLEFKLATSAPGLPVSKQRKSSRIALVVALPGAAICVVASFFLPGNVGLAVALMALLLELFAFATLAVNTIRDDLPEFIDAKRKYASELETEYGLYCGILEWIRTCPVETLNARYRYLQTRKKTFDQRFGLLTGGAERLGIFPIVVALYFQFKDVQWWPVVFDLKNALLALLIALFYALCLWLVRLRLRLDVYVLVLGDALNHGGTRPEPDA